jgi:hypothetical protein
MGNGALAIGPKLPPILDSTDPESPERTGDSACWVPLRANG